MCVVYLNYMYYVKTGEEMLSMRYFGTLYAVIYSLNLDLANRCVFANVKAGNIHAFTFTLDSDAILSHP